MLVVELELTGIVRDANGGNIAVVMGSDSKGISFTWVTRFTTGA